MIRVDPSDLTDRDRRILAVALYGGRVSDSDRRVEALRSGLGRERRNHVRHGRAA